MLIHADRDVIVAAATAAGKTEAAFLPALTHLLQSEEPRLIVYISPLKALINGDQFGRLDKFCEQLDIPVWPWHGDIGATSKTKFLEAAARSPALSPRVSRGIAVQSGTSIAAVFQMTAFCGR